MFSHRVRTIHQPRLHPIIISWKNCWMGNPRKSAYVSVRPRCAPQNACDTLESGSVAEGRQQVT